MMVMSVNVKTVPQVSLHLCPAELQLNTIQSIYCRKREKQYWVQALYMSTGQHTSS